MKHAVIITALIILGAPTLGFASKPVTEGTARFGMDLFAASSVDPQGRFSVAVTTWCNPEASRDRATARVEVVGAEVLEGPTTRTLRPSEHGLWKLILLRKVGEGPVEIRGVLDIPGSEPGVRYFGTDVLKLEVRGSEVVQREKRAMQRLKLLNGRRFRYGGTYLVAIDDDETEDPGDIESPPEIIKGGPIQCPECALEASVEVRVVVTVGKTGLVTWIRPNAHVDSRIWGAILKGLASYRFRPARAGNRDVADAAVLSVRVEPR